MILKNKASLKAGVVYFLITFAFGFILGTFRVLVVIPRIGELTAVLLETPVMIVVSWFFCRLLIQKFSLQRQWLPLFIFGGSAFVFLMITEFIFSTLVFQHSTSEYLEELFSLTGVVGLSGQILFGALPLFWVRK